MKIEIPKDLKIKLIHKYGDIVNHINLKGCELENNEIEITCSFKIYQTIRISNKSLSNNIFSGDDVINYLSTGLCDNIEKIVFDRFPTVNIDNLNIIINRYIKDDHIYVSPKTYSESQWEQYLELK